MDLMGNKKLKKLKKMGIKKLGAEVGISALGNYPAGSLTGSNSWTMPAQQCGSQYNYGGDTSVRVSRYGPRDCMVNKCQTGLTEFLGFEMCT
eukprot:COSAG02_NODE_26078_length_641_cov_4.806757_1_plen_91_part_10